jgi:ribokinase
MNRLVTVVGSLHYDLLVEAEHLPRRGETAVGQSWRPKFGGKGRNQAVAAAVAGAQTQMIGCVGADDFGRAMLDDLDRYNVRRSGVITLEAATGMSVAISMPDGDYGAVIVSSTNLGLQAEWISRQHVLLEGTRILLLQNEVPEAANIAASEIVKSHGGFVILNAAPTRPVSTRLSDAVDLLVVNEIEAAQMSSVTSEGRTGILEAAMHLAEQWSQVVVTAGGNGIVFADGSSPPVELPAEPVKVRSTHGAGDCFVGTLAAHLSQDESMTDALQGAIRTAGKFVAGFESVNSS